MAAPSGPKPVRRALGGTRNRPDTLQPAKVLQDRHVLEILLGQSVPRDTCGWRGRVRDGDRLRRGDDDRERKIGLVPGKLIDELQVVDGGCDRHRRMAELAEDRVL